MQKGTQHVELIALSKLKRIPITIVIDLWNIQENVRFIDIFEERDHSNKKTLIGSI